LWAELNNLQKPAEYSAGFSYITGMKVIATLFLFLFFPVASQQQQGAKDYARWYEAGNKLYELENPTVLTDSLALYNYSKTISILRGKAEFSSILFDSYIKCGTIYQGQHQYQRSLPYYNFVLKEAVAKKDSLNLYKANLYKGSCKYSLNEIDSAAYYLEKAYGYVKHRTQLPDLTVLFNSLGIIYFEAANYRQAINYFQLAIDRLPRDDDSYEESLVSFKNNIASCLGKLGKYREALNEYKRLFSYRQLSASLMQNTGHMYFSLGLYDSALYFLNKVPYSKTPGYVKLMNEKARIYMQQGQLSTAETFFDSAIALNKRLPGNLKNKDKANSYLYRSQLAYKQGLTEEALTWCNVSLEELHFSFKWSKEEDLPASVKDVVSPVTFFEVLKFKAFLQEHKYKTTGNERYLQLALQTWQLAVKTSNYIKTSFDNDEAELFFNESISNMYKSASLAAANLYAKTGDKKYINEYLFITESFKGNVVYKNLIAASARDNGILPDSLVKKEKQLKQLLAVFTTRLNNLTSSEGLDLVRKKITSIQYELSRLQKQYEQIPQYSDIKNPDASSRISVTQIQKAVNQNAVIIQYLWCDSILICLSVTNKETNLSTAPVMPQLQTQLQHYANALYAAQEGLRFEDYKIAGNLYRFLMGEKLINASDKKQLIILPDGPLNYLPFETLLTNEERRRWLVFDKIISYHYSFSLWLYKKPASNERSLFAAAPFAGNSFAVNDTYFSRLPYSEKETQLIKGAKLTNEAATKKTVTELSKTSSLIHLATHAVSATDTGKSRHTFIQFYHNRRSPVENSRLYLHEIYNLRFTNHPLLILSACETAAGNSTNGEGLLSMSRAFLYAGASGIVSSLWKAEDKVTAYLMERFHFYIQKGMETEQALQKARIDFLNNDDFDVRFKTPNYWGHFVYIGETGREIQTAGLNGFDYMLPAGIIVFVLLLFFLLWQKLKSQKGSV
jgi:CHAT domain-containing protein/tetratricopeptide (TPR) repeat protein